MGLFSDKCPKCNHSNSKKSNHCNQCASPLNLAWRKCRCGASCGATSKACWRCGSDLNAQPHAELFGDRWTRTIEEFAVRFPIRAPEGTVHHGVQVDEGTRAILLVNGRAEKEVLEPGYHVQTGFFERLLGMQKKGQQSEALLYSIAPMHLSFDVGGLFDSEQIPLTATVKVGIEMDDAARFLITAMPTGTTTFGSTELGGLIGNELYALVQNRVSTYTVESLLSDISQRESLEAVMAPEIAPLLDAYGLRFTGLRLAHVTGEAVEIIREKLGTKAVRIRQYELDRELEELDRQHRLKTITTTYEYNEQEKQLALDYGLKDSERDLFRRRWEENTEHQLVIEGIQRGTEEWKARFGSQREKIKEEQRAALEDEDHQDDLLRVKRGRELTDLRHGNAIAAASGDLEVTKAMMAVRVSKINDDYAREKKRLDAEAEHEQDVKGLELAFKARDKAIEVLGKIKQIERDDATHEYNIKKGEEEAKARAYAGLSKDAIMAVSGDPKVISGLTRLAEIQAGQTVPGPFNQHFSGLPATSPPAPPPAHGQHFQPHHPSAPLPTQHSNTYSPKAFHGMAGNDEMLQDVSRNASPCVGVIVGQSGSATQPFGTGFLIGKRILATNAHVAEAALEMHKNGKGISVIFGMNGARVSASVRHIAIHPNYEKRLTGGDGSKPAVPAYDVAIMVLDRDFPKWLPIADPQHIIGLSAGQRVGYCGFPMEGVAGGGVNLNSPCPIFKSGIISAVTDWWLGSTNDHTQRLLIQHDLGVAGGASGSPLLNLDGYVIGLISAGNMNPIFDGEGGMARAPSGVALNYAQRVDLLGDLLQNS